MSGGTTFEEVWNEYAKDKYGKEFTAFHVPEEFAPEDYDSVGYIPVERRSSNEAYSWSQFYDFWSWLKDRGFIKVSDRCRREDSE